MRINPNGNAHLLGSDSSWPITPDEALAEWLPLSSNTLTHKHRRACKHAHLTKDQPSPALLLHINISELTNCI